MAKSELEITREVWAEVDKHYKGPYETIGDWARYCDTLRCALADEITRNRTEKPALTEDMVGKAFNHGYDVVIELLREHGALAEPVDRDLELAREVVKDVQKPGQRWLPVDFALAAIKRVRAEYE